MEAYNYHQQLQHHRSLDVDVNRMFDQYLYKVRDSSSSLNKDLVFCFNQPSPGFIYLFAQLENSEEEMVIFSSSRGLWCLTSVLSEEERLTRKT